MRSIHPLAVFVAFVALQILGFVWYHEAVFGTPWMIDVGIDPQNVPEPPASVWVIMAIGTLVKVVLIGVFLSALRIEGLGQALLWGFILGFGMLAMTLASHHGFALRPPRQSLIEGAQEIVGATVAAGIFALIPPRRS